MYIIPAQYDGFRTNSIGDRKIIFSADESMDLGDFNPAKMKRGVQFLVILLDETELEQKIDVNTTVRERLNNKFHSLVADLADKEGISADKMKEKIKKEESIEHISQLSLKELAKLVQHIENQ